LQVARAQTGCAGPIVHKTTVDAIPRHIKSKQFWCSIRWDKLLCIIASPESPSTLMMQKKRAPAEADAL
jgi:hypothetical protein